MKNVTPEHTNTQKQILVQTLCMCVSIQCAYAVLPRDQVSTIDRTLQNKKKKLCVKTIPQASIIIRVLHFML